MSHLQAIRALCGLQGRCLCDAHKKDQHFLGRGRMSYLLRGRRLLRKHGSNGKQSLIALVLRQGQIVSVGRNSYCKTHPRQSRLAEKVGQPKREYLHAEIAALLKAPRNADTLVVVRLNKQGDFCNAKPCEICQLAIREFGIKTVIHS